MSMDGSYNKAILSTIYDAKTDWVMVYGVIWNVCRGVKTMEDRRLVMETLRILFEDDLMFPGEIGEGQIDQWEGGPKEWLVQAEAYLEEEGWDPDLQGFWLDLTPKGKLIGSSIATAPYADEDD